ncbi:hypothetical protein ABZ816_21920 [Actinosynnema sp. NPDC047251]|uniref:Uncharacterized protein n=1 Tax=Saccharothrix espanaensis (strain ATCC 51144 / DSM 44229 / JCM 9112 / NBRC 15066 / NRRL 15764) TaxID=1179773 RepID=K0KAU0_SACES|nr:hypothetical protein [Saccharothrix espanaensis]CCH33738.1 hypothetical protein BN6_64960 [Saccharothrix espanaensis DSM 44229]
MRDPILEGALRRVRDEKARDRGRRGRLRAATSAALAAAVLAGGLHLGRHSLPAHRILVATTGSTRMTTTITPADGWVRLHAAVDGIDPGERCTLVVTDSHGRRYVAGGWVAARREHTDLDGAALVDPADLATISVVTVDGRTLVTTTA